MKDKLFFQCYLTAMYYVQILCLCGQRKDSHVLWKGRKVILNESVGASMDNFMVKNAG